MEGDNDTNSNNTETDIVITCGMTFNTREEAHVLYTAYAENKGFSIRMRNSRANLIQIVCSREGFHTPKENTTLVGDCSHQGSSRSTKSSRVGCKACLHCGLNPMTKLWQITKFYDCHNHDLVTPKSKKYLRSHKKFTPAARALCEAFSSQGIPLSKVPAILNTGNDEVEFTSKDCYNHISEVRRKELDKGDASAVHNYCVRQQEENPDFSYSFSVDEDGRMTNFFWVDARSKKAYEIFGDVVSFDTTYRTNKYNMPFAPFVGINNHKQTILFGCALMQDEREESFIWLFKAWLRAMDGKHPISLITDQDGAMMNAVAKVFPTVKHHFCLWHIMKKFPEKLSHIFHNKPSFKTDLNRCIHGSISTQQFEDGWQRLVIEYNLIENKWLQNLYFIRHLWVPCFTKGVFYGGMTTTGISESINAFFDGYVHSGMTLQEIVIKCEAALNSRYEAFRKAEFDSRHKVPVLTLNMSLENHAAGVYTSEIFFLFQKELKGILGCERHKINEESTRETYRAVGPFDSGEGVVVEYDTSTNESRCECILFEFKGILCTHILSIFHMHNVREIPSNYIMKRWTRDVAYPIFACKVASRVEANTSMGSYNLKNKLDELYDISKRSDIVFKHVDRGIDDFLMSTKRKFGDNLSEEMDNESHGNDNYVNENQSVQILDPNVTQTKGRKRASKGKIPRIQSGLEESTKNTNRCSICNQKGHNKRKCPQAGNQL